MQRYRSVCLAMQSVEWSDSGGSKYFVKVALDREELDYFGNGDFKITRQGLIIAITATINGIEYIEAAKGIVKLPQPFGDITHHLGKIALTTDLARQISAAFKIVEASPQWEGQSKKQPLTSLRTA